MMFGIRVEKDTSALTRLIASAPEKIDQVLGKVVKHAVPRGTAVGWDMF